ncbi:hypothetical protein [Mangrovibacterium sp.]|uniref:hypothetical protein n=1 Tax=Mangrovibacterium sp. TaxID=1961364 RepID=UPI00356B2C6B
MKKWRFDFGNGKAANGYIKIDAETVYSEEKGFGILSEKKVISGTATRRIPYQAIGYLPMLLSIFSLMYPKAGIKLR